MPTQSYSVVDLIAIKLDFSAQRQKVIAQNIANADTPGYKAQDLANPDFRTVLQNRAREQSLKRTHPGHFSDPAGTENYRTVVNPFKETSPNGNSVILDQQLLMMNDVVADHRLASRIYSKYRELNRIAFSAPGG